MTVAEVKAQLPDVRVRWFGKDWWARVTGRLCPTACVSPYKLCKQGKLIQTIMGPCYHCSWEQVALAVSNPTTAIYLD